MSILSERPKDCLGCKLVGGFGLIGASLYVMSHARRFDGYQKGAMMIMASSLSFFGVARLLNLQVFPVFPVKDDKPNEK